MITQYTRFIVDNTTGVALHVTSQDFPFAEGYEPVDFDTATHTAYDYEIVADFPDQDHGFGKDQKMLRAREILENFEVVNGQAQLQAGRSNELKAKVLAISPRKDISEAGVVAEMLANIREGLAAGGSNEAELLGSINKQQSVPVEQLSDMSTLAIMRIKAEINKAK